MTTKTMTVAELAALLASDIAAYADSLGPSYTWRQIGKIRWMLATAEVRYTDTMIMIRIDRRGFYTTDADFVATALFDGLLAENRTDGKGDKGGHIRQIRTDVWALDYACRCVNC